MEPGCTLGEINCRNLPLQFAEAAKIEGTHTVFIIHKFRIIIQPGRGRKEYSCSAAPLPNLLFMKHSGASKYGRERRCDVPRSHASPFQRIKFYFYLQQAKVITSTFHSLFLGAYSRKLMHFEMVFFFLNKRPFWK